MTLKLRAKVNFPATVTATGGLQVVKANGIWTVSPDWSYLTLETTLPDAAGRQLWTLDPVSNTYYRLSVQALIDNLPDGPAGTAATITAGTTTTDRAGASATASNSGTSSAAVFDFTIPRGADAGLRYAFEASTSMAAPASGGLRLNNAALASVTAIAASATNSDAVDVSDFIATWDDSTNTVKGYVEVRKEGSGAVLGLYQLTSVTDNTTWLQLAVTYVSGSGSFTAADSLYLTPYRTGNKGADGAGTGDFSSNTATSVDGEMLLFSGTDGKTGKRSTLTGGILKSTSGVPAIATAGDGDAIVSDASATVKGKVELATDAETQTGTDTVRAITPANLTAAARKQGKETIFIPASAMKPRTTNGPSAGSVEQTTNKNMVVSLDFDTTTQEFAQFSTALPKSWNLGTVTFRPFLSQLTTAAGGVVFGCAGVAVSSGDALDVAFGTAQTSTITVGTANLEYVGPESAAITIAGTPAAADRIMFQINRTVADGSDTLAQDARLHGIWIHFTTNAATDS